MTQVRKHRLFSILSVVLIFLFIFAFNSPLLVLATEIDEVDESEENAEPIINYCGKEATWELENGVLTIGGTGAIANYTESEPAPWSDRLIDINTIIIKNGITSIGNYAFANTVKLTKVVIANSVEFIGIGAFYASGIKEINLPNSIKTISKLAFANAHIRKINLSRGLKYAAERVFYNCQNLTTISIPEGVTTIDYEAFGNCMQLKEISLPTTLTDIELKAFENCTELTKIKVYFSDPYQCLAYGKFPNANTAEIYVPKGTATFFKECDYWEPYKDIIFEGDFEGNPEDITETEDMHGRYSDEDKNKVDPFAIAFIAIIIVSFFFATAYYFISTIHKTHKKNRAK